VSHWLALQQATHQRSVNSRGKRFLRHGGPVLAIHVFVLFGRIELKTWMPRRARAQQFSSAI
jgi:hypothetical protein